MNAAALFVECLEEEGVEWVFCVPGEENLDLLEALRTSRIRLVVTRHEQHAAFMAAAHGRLTGRAGVCLATLGPGATNLVTGVAQANLCGMPLVAVTGQKPRRDNWQGTFQVIDVVDTFGPLTKWTTSLAEARAIPSTIRHAFKTAEAERPGAVHIELPEDVAREGAGSHRPKRRVRLRRPVADDKAIRLAAELVRGARRPLLLVASGGNRKRIGKQLTRFVEGTGIYSVSTQMGKGVLPEDHPRSLFSLGIHRKDYVHRAIERADLMITVGYSIVEYPPAVWNDDGSKRILHVDFRPAEVDPAYCPTLELVGDVSHSLWALREALCDSPREDEWLRALRSFLGEKLHGDVEPRFPIGPRALTRQVRTALRRDDIVCLDNGIFKIWFSRCYEAYAENTLLVDNALATMGAGLATAMTASLLRPGHRVLAVCGDGGFMMNGQDLETAVRLALPIVILLVRDDAYGFIRWKQAELHLADFGMTFGNPDFALHAESFGAIGLRFEGEMPLARMLDQAFERAEQARVPVLVDCPIDYDENRELGRDFMAEMPAFQEETR